MPLKKEHVALLVDLMQSPNIVVPVRMGRLAAQLYEGVLELHDQMQPAHSFLIVSHPPAAVDPPREPTQDAQG